MEIESVGEALVWLGQVGGSISFERTDILDPSGGQPFTRLEVHALGMEEHHLCSEGLSGEDMNLLVMETTNDVREQIRKMVG